MFDRHCAAAPGRGGDPSGRPFPVLSHRLRSRWLAWEFRSVLRAVDPGRPANAELEPPARALANRQLTRFGGPGGWQALRRRLSPLPALGVLVKLEQDFVGSGLEVNRHAILIQLQGTGRELLEDLLTVHPDLLAVIDAEQKYGVDRLLELDLGVRIANAVVAVGDRRAEVSRGGRSCPVNPETPHASTAFASCRTCTGLPRSRWAHRCSSSPIPGSCRRGRTVRRPTSGR